jgi:serine/threonine protein kinase
MERFQPLGLGAGTILAHRYDVIRLLGAGAMSAVYLVSDRELSNDIIALKLFSPKLLGDEVQLQRFRNEVLISRKLNHPNIIRVYDFGRDDNGYFYMTMEYVKGKTLEELVENKNGRNLDLTQSVKILNEISKGISFAHEAGIIHRDLKPANILIGENGQVKIADFGLAQATEVNMRLTQTGECVGTPYYMAPEQVQEKPMDQRSDIYAIGIIGYELATGAVPFPEQSWYNLAVHIVQTPIPDFVTKKNGIPSWFQEFVKKAAAKKPEERFQTAKEVMSYLEQYLPADYQLNISTDEDPRVTRASTLRRRAPITNDNLSLTFFRYAPFLMGLAVIVLSFIILLTASDTAVKQVSQTLDSKEQDIDKVFETVDRFGASLGKMQQLAIDYSKNKEAIDAFLSERSEAENSEKREVKITTEKQAENTASSE